MVSLLQLMSSSRSIRSSRLRRPYLESSIQIAWSRMPFGVQSCRVAAKTVSTSLHFRAEGMPSNAYSDGPISTAERSRWVCPQLCNHRKKLRRALATLLSPVRRRVVARSFMYSSTSATVRSATPRPDRRSNQPRKLRASLQRFKTVICANPRTSVIHWAYRSHISRQKASAEVRAGRGAGQRP